VTLFVTLIVPQAPPISAVQMLYWRQDWKHWMDMAEGTTMKRNTALPTMVSRRAWISLALAGGGAALLNACGAEALTRTAQPTVPPRIAQPTVQPTTQTQERVEMELQKVVAGGVELHYIEQGTGVPVVLVHGGLADYREWGPQMGRFAQNYRTIAYSRRYNYPNRAREIAPDHSALVEAEDLAALIGALNLERPHVVGYSYGAFTALGLGLEHPTLVRSLVLAEPPVLRWASDAPGGAEVLSQFMALWESIGDAFKRDDKELALRRTLQLFYGADILDQLPPEVRQFLEANIKEWEALTTSRDAFPLLAREGVAQMQLPTLLLSGGATLPIHQIVNTEIEHVLTHGQRVTLQGATHDMWTEQPDACGAAVLQFLSEHP
jgi:pimeloyl-ACP methyl ester carboxylesterase